MTASARGLARPPNREGFMTNVFRRIFVLTVAAGAAGMVSCSKDATPAPTSPASATASTAAGKPNLVLITMEATRPDHLGCYDDPLAATPSLDQLAREGAVFANAIAVAPLTLPSTASILTALYPARHKLRSNTGYFFAKATMAEHLKEQGYATAAAVGTHALARELGFGRGFDTYAESRPASRTADAVVDDAIEAVNRMKGHPFFLWVELDDPHAPYTPPPAYRARFENRPYDGEIAWVDAQLKRLFDRLRGSGVFDGTVVVATADHGESLGEHGEDAHGLFLYDSTVKVPLIVRYPARIGAGTKFDGLVSGVDLAPTLLALMGLPPMAPVEGESCAASLLGENVPGREAAYSESLLGQEAYGWVPLHALRSTVEKFVDGPEPELYNLKRDPSETINLATTDAAAVAKSWRPSMDEALRVMGIVGPEAMPARAPRKARRDVKGLVAAHNLIQKAEQAIEAGQPEQAAPLLRQALAKDPENPAAGSSLLMVGANTFSVKWNLGNELYEKGNLPEAAKAFRAALAANPQSAEARFALGNVLAAQGDAPGAAAEFRAAVTVQPKWADAWNKLGIALDRSNHHAESLAAFNSALAAAPDHADALFNRAKIELLGGQLADARRDVDRLLSTHADYPAGRFLEAHLCTAEGNTACAKAALTKYLALPNTDPRLRASAEDMLKKIGG